MRLLASALALGMVTQPSCAQTAPVPQVIEEPIEPNAWSDGPRPVVLRCAGLIDVLMSVQPHQDLLTASGLFLLEARELATDEKQAANAVTDLKAFAAAYKALPMVDSTQTLVAADFQSCWTFAMVLQEKWK